MRVELNSCNLQSDGDGRGEGIRSVAGSLHKINCINLGGIWDRGAVYTVYAELTGTDRGSFGRRFPDYVHCSVFTIYRCDLIDV